MHDDALDDVRDRFGLRAAYFDLRGRGVDVQGKADHDGAEVERADLRACDRDDRERRAVVGARQIDLAGCLGENCADARFDDRVADFARGGTGRFGFLLGAALSLASLMSASGQNGMPGQVARQAGRKRGGEARDLLFAVFAEDPQIERAVGATGVVLGAGYRPAA